MFLWIDQARQYYFMTEKEWMDSCKTVNAVSYACTQNHPLLSSHLHDNCMVKLMQPRGNTPSSCDKRVVEISNC